VNKRYRENWIVHPHTPIQGIEPLVDYAPGKQYGPEQLDPPARARAASTLPQRRTVKVGDYFLTPTRFTVNRGSRITWKWLAENIDLHDVALVRAPAGVRKWKSDLAATDFTYRRTLRVPGRYRVICTLHPDTMVQRITVRQ
jgi:plastocyanin